MCSCALVCICHEVDPRISLFVVSRGKLERAQAVAPAHVGRLQLSKGRANLYLGSIRRCENRAVTTASPTLSGSSEATRRSVFSQSCLETESCVDSVAPSSSSSYGLGFGTSGLKHKITPQSARPNLDHLLARVNYSLAATRAIPANSHRALASAFQCR
jgi:hypothetical protein